MKNKKVLFYILLGLDIALTVFLLVLSIIMLAQTIGKTAAEIDMGTGFIAYLQQHPTFYGLVFVLPLFLLLAGNIIGLVIYVKKNAKAEAQKEQVNIDNISDELRADLLKELAKDLNKESKEEKKDE